MEKYYQSSWKIDIVDLFKNYDLSSISQEIKDGQTPFNVIIDEWLPHGCPSKNYTKLEPAMLSVLSKDDIIDVAHRLLNLMWPSGDMYKFGKGRFPDPANKKIIAAHILSHYFKIKE